MSFGWGGSDEACESYAWLKFCWLLRKTLIWQLLTFDDLRVFIDETWLTFDQMIYSKCWCWPKTLKFDCMLTIVDFLSNIVDFQSSEPLTEQTCDAKHET